MTFTQLKTFHSVFVDNWDEWVKYAPDYWKHDGWLEGHVPVSVCYKYGQNRQILEEGEPADTELFHWHNDLNYDNIRYLTVALATHLTCVILIILFFIFN